MTILRFNAKKQRKVTRQEQAFEENRTLVRALNKAVDHLKAYIARFGKLSDEEISRILTELRVAEAEAKVRAEKIQKMEASHGNLG